MKRVNLAACSAICVLLLCVSAPCAQEPAPVWERGTAVEKDGNIWFTDAGGIRVQMTDSGLDSSPVVSLDEQKIAFVRHTPGTLVDAGFGGVEANEIWLVDVKQRQARMLVRGAKEFAGTGPLASLRDPHFSPEGDRVFFSGTQGTTGGVYATDLATGASKFISPGNRIVDVIPIGKFRGYLIVIKHKYLGPPEGGSYDWFWIEKPDGAEVAPLGDERLAQRFCGWSSNASQPTPREAAAEP
jgi:hypothetical protein